MTELITTIATTQEQHLAAVQWDDSKIDLVRKTIMDHDATRHEAELFAHLCQQTGLDPFSRQIYALRLGGGRLSFLTSIDGFRVVAQRSNDYAGQDGPYWCGDDGKWVDVWLSEETPAAAKVGVLRTNFKEPIYAVAKFAEYKAGSPIWRKMPALMIAKCAESLALRRAFPNDLSGIYGEDEMDQAKTMATELIEQTKAPITADEAREIENLIDDTGASLESVLTYAKVESVDLIPAKLFAPITKKLKARGSK